LSDFSQGLSFGKPVGDSIRDQPANLLKALEQESPATRDIKMRLPWGLMASLKRLTMQALYTQLNSFGMFSIHDSPILRFQGWYFAVAALPVNVLEMWFLRRCRH
jgi:hypothetical protein